MVRESEQGERKQTRGQDDVKWRRQALNSQTDREREREEEDREQWTIPSYLLLLTDAD
jgi:hypothetical protein